MKPLRSVLFIMNLLALPGLPISLFACSCVSDFNGVDSLRQLDAYGFIAHIRIVGDVPLKTPDGRLAPNTGLLKIEIIEQFKGNPSVELTEMERNTSCDMGFDEGEEWIVFAKTSGPRPAVYPCDRNVMYRERNGFRDWQGRRGVRELDDLRRLFGHKVLKPADGVHKEYYPGNKIQVEENYVGGMLNGRRKVYYLTGKVYGIEHYINDTLNGPSEWYYPTGQLSLRQFFRSGKNNNARISFHDTTWNNRNPGLPQSTLISHQIVYNAAGEEILSRKFSRTGVIIEENIYDPGRHLNTSIHYGYGGVISSIRYYRNGLEYGHYQEYDAYGSPTKSWDYDANGKQINIHIPK